MSQSPQAGQFNSYEYIYGKYTPTRKESQSPQAGQFNSYKKDDTNYLVSALVSQSPQAGQFNSYDDIDSAVSEFMTSQSPQAGQFNSYICSILVIQMQILNCLNPLKRVNSILTRG